MQIFIKFNNNQPVNNENNTKTNPKKNNLKTDEL